MLSRLSIYCLLIVCFTGVTTSAAEKVAMASGTKSFQLGHEKRSWQTVMHVPQKLSYHKEKPVVVLALHGAGGSGQIMLDQNGWKQQAEQGGFIAVAPNGLPAIPEQRVEFLTNPRLWNSGQLPAQSARAQYDDIQFIQKLIESVHQQLAVKECLWFVTGHSNGAGLTFKLAVEIPDQWQAIAPVAGPLAVTANQLPHPIPTLYILGTLDPLQPLKGGEVLIPWGKMVTTPVDQIVTYWCDANGCQAIPKQKLDNQATFEQFFGNDANDIIRTVYIKGHGHRWPGGIHGQIPVLFQHFVGPVKNDFNATKEIWAFFESQLEGTEK